MGRSVRTRVEALIKKEGYGAQKTIARLSGVAQPTLCQWLKGRYAGNSDKIAGALAQFLIKLAASDGGLPPPGKPGRRTRRDERVLKPALATASRASSKARSDSQTATAAASSGVVSSIASGWSSAEDAMLRRLVQRHGACMWATKAKQLGGRRSENAVRSRWHMYLRPDAPFSSTPARSPAPKAKSSPSTPAEKTSASKERAQPTPVQRTPSLAPRGGNVSCTYSSYLPPVSYFAEDGDEELPAAVAVMIKPLPKRGPHLAREWTALPKTTREMMLANQPEAVEPPAKAATMSPLPSATCTLVTRRDAAPLPPIPAPTITNTSTSMPANR